MKKPAINKTILTPVVCLMVTLSTFSAHGRDQIQDFSIEEIMTSEKAISFLGTDIKFYFGSQKHPEITKRFGEFGSNKKTNAFNKSDVEACNHVFLSAMASLRDRAKREGGNAVINIKSNYKGDSSSSTATFKCGAGNVIAGVALLGTIVQIR